MYVDDLIVTGSSTEIISKFNQAIAMKFDMNYLGLLTYYLGIEIHQREKDITVIQEGYARKVLKNASMFDCNLTLTLMDANVKYSKGDGEEDVDATEYQILVERLRYFLQTKTDLSYVVGITSRYMQEPKKSYMLAFK